MSHNGSKGFLRFKTVRIILLLLFIGLLLIAVQGYLRYKRTHITTDDAYIKGHIHWIYPRINGKVIKVLVDDNQYVKKDEPLVILDPDIYKVRLSQALAQLKLSQAQLKVALNNVSAVAAEVDLNEAEYQRALLDFNRAKRLYQAKVMPKQKYDYYQTAYKVAQAKLVASKKRLICAKNQVKTAKAQVEINKALVANARLNLEYTQIKAPIAGYITKKTVEVGNEVGPERPLLAIVPLNDIWIEANYKENQIERIKPGQKVIIKVDAYPKQKFIGKVVNIQAGTGAVFSLFPPENASGNWVKITQRIPVKIAILSPHKPILRIGMSVTTTVLAK